MKILSSLFGLILGCAFAGGGFMIAMETAIPTYRDWHAMRQWRPATATLLHVSGSDNKTEANYRYSIAGIEYQNDRVYVATSEDNIGSYHRDLTRHLQWLKQNGQKVPIWYAPDDPAKAVIDRDMRWGLFALMAGFCSIFVLIGLGIAYASLRPNTTSRGRRNKPSLFELKRQWRQQQAEISNNTPFLDFVRQQAEQYQQSTTPVPSGPRRSPSATPWLDKKEWRSNRIRSNAKTSLYFMWGFAIVWSAISTPILFVLEDELNKQNYAALFGLLFPLVGLFLLSKAWKMTREWRRFGIIELQLDPFPGSIGGHVGGSLLLTKVSDFRTPYKVALECVNTYVSGSGDNRSRRESVRWAEEGFAEAEAGGRGVRLEFRFDVPEGLPEADVEQRGDYYFWRLSLSAEIDGIPLNRQYNIPVFHTNTHSRFIRHDNSALAEENRKEKALASLAAINRGDFSSTSLAKALIYKNEGGKHLFYYPMFRNKLLTLFALIFACGFDFAAFMINQNFTGNGMMSIFMLIFSIPFALVGLIATIAAIYLPFNNLRVSLNNGNITALRRLLFIPIQSHYLASHDIQRIEIKSSGSTGQGVKQIKHYKLIVHGKNRQKFAIAEDIDGEDLAEQLRDFIGKRLGLAPELTQRNLHLLTPIK